MTLSARDNNNADLRSRISALESRVNILPGRIHSDGKPRATWRTFIQEDHEFEVGHIVRFDADDDAWVKSLADSAEHAFYGGMVVSVPTPHTFAIAMPGSYVNGLGDLGIDKGIWYLSADDEGELVDTAPSLAVPILMADSDNSGVLLASASAAAEVALITVGTGNLIVTYNSVSYYGIKNDAGAVPTSVPTTTPPTGNNSCPTNLSAGFKWNQSGVGGSTVWIAIRANPGTGDTFDFAASIAARTPIISRRSVLLPIDDDPPNLATVHIVTALG